MSEHDINIAWTIEWDAKSVTIVVKIYVEMGRTTMPAANLLRVRLRPLTSTLFNATNIRVKGNSEEIMLQV